MSAELINDPKSFSDLMTYGISCPEMPYIHLNPKEPGNSRPPPSAVPYPYKITTCGTSATTCGTSARLAPLGPSLYTGLKTLNAGELQPHNTHITGADARARWLLFGPSSRQIIRRVTDCHLGSSAAVSSLYMSSRISLATPTLLGSEALSSSTACTQHTDLVSTQAEEHGASPQEVK